MTSSTTKPLIAAGFDCICRGDIDIKGKDKPMTTYLLAPPSVEKGDSTWLQEHVIKNGEHTVECIDIDDSSA